MSVISLSASWRSTRLPKNPLFGGLTAMSWQRSKKKTQNPNKATPKLFPASLKEVTLPALGNKSTRLG